MGIVLEGKEKWENNAGFTYLNTLLAVGSRKNKITPFGLPYGVA